MPGVRCVVVETVSGDWTGLTSSIKIYCRLNRYMFGLVRNALYLYYTISFADKLYSVEFSSSDHRW